jgi:hypothetical protein
MDVSLLTIRRLLDYVSRYVPLIDLFVDQKTAIVEEDHRLND